MSHESLRTVIAIDKNSIMLEIIILKDTFIWDKEAANTMRFMNRLFIRTVSKGLN